MQKTPSPLHLPLYMRPVRWRRSFTTSSPSPSPKSGTWKMAEFIKVKIQDTSEKVKLTLKKVNLTFSKVSLTFFEINRRWNGVLRNFCWQIKYKSGVRFETEGEPKMFICNALFISALNYKVKRWSILGTSLYWGGSKSGHWGTGKSGFGRFSFWQKKRLQEKHRAKTRLVKPYKGDG